MLEAAATGAAQTRTQRYTAAQAYGGHSVPQLYPPSFPQLQQTASGAGQSVRRAGRSAGTMQRVSVSLLCLWEDGAPSGVLHQDISMSQCMCVGNCVVATGRRNERADGSHGLVSGEDH